MVSDALKVFFISVLVVVQAYTYQHYQYYDPACMSCAYAEQAGNFMYGSSFILSAANTLRQANE